MPPSSTYDDTPHTWDSATDCFTCDSCGQGNFTCITFIKPAAGERRDGAGLGFDVSRDHTQCRTPDDCFYVREIIAGGLADRDGRLKEGRITPQYLNCSLFNSLLIEKRQGHEMKISSRSKQEGYR